MKTLENGLKSTRFPYPFYYSNRQIDIYLWFPSIDPKAFKLLCTKLCLWPPFYMLHVPFPSYHMDGFPGHLCLRVLGSVCLGLPLIDLVAPPGGSVHCGLCSHQLWVGKRKVSLKYGWFDLSHRSNVYRVLIRASFHHTPCYWCTFCGIWLWQFNTFNT